MTPFSHTRKDVNLADLWERFKAAREAEIERRKDLPPVKQWDGKKYLEYEEQLKTKQDGY
jgi:hypothetical protein